MFNIEYDIIDEINIGSGAQLRLVENIESKRRVIQLWSNLSKQWNVIHRYEVEEAWAGWKRTEASINSRAEKKVKKSRKRG